LLAARANFRQAVAVRQSAKQVCAKYGTGRATLWFEGHWGFQYYMDKLGALPVALKESPLKTGDYLAFPINNDNTFPPQQQYVSELVTMVVPSPRILTVMNLSAGSGFFASVTGPLPFAFGPALPEKVYIITLNIPVNKMEKQ
jgi:hypothetical protein